MKQQENKYKLMKDVAELCRLYGIEEVQYWVDINREVEKKCE